MLHECEEQGTQAWWDESIRMLGDFHFLDKLVGYDRDSMTDEVMNQIKVRKVAGGHAPGQCEGGQEWASQFHHSYSCFTHLPLPPPPAPPLPLFLQLFIDLPQFDPRKMVNVSVAAATLCKWVKAMHQYHQVRARITHPRTFNTCVK